MKFSMKMVLAGVLAVVTGFSLVRQAAAATKGDLLGEYYIVRDNTPTGNWVKFEDGGFGKAKYTVLDGEGKVLDYGIVSINGVGGSSTTFTWASTKFTKPQRSGQLEQVDATTWKGIREQPTHLEYDLIKIGS